MIITVTLNPAVDKTLTAQGLIPGRVNRMKQVSNIAGGKGINVAKILLSYGYDTAVLGLIGGYPGAFIENHMREIKACTAFTKISGETRVSTNIIGDDGFITEILEPGPEISKTETDRFLADYKIWLEESELIVLSGSAPRGVAPDIYARLISIAKKQNKKVILDTSGELLANGVKEKPFMIKPNINELEYLVRHPVKGIEAAAEILRSLVHGGIGHILLSLGRHGLLYAKSGEAKVLYAKPPAIKVKNTIGCGDSVVASFCMSHLKGDDMPETLRLAAAISASSATRPGIADISRDTVKELYHEIKITEVD